MLQRLHRGSWVQKKPDRRAYVWCHHLGPARERRCPEPRRGGVGMGAESKIERGWQVDLYRAQRLAEHEEE